MRFEQYKLGSRPFPDYPYLNFNQYLLSCPARIHPPPHHTVTSPPRTIRPSRMWTLDIYSLVLGFGASAAPMCTTALEPSKTLALTGVTHFVTAGSNLRFDPENIVAETGDIVEWHFLARNHSVAQSSFDRPCVPAEENSFLFWLLPNCRKSKFRRIPNHCTTSSPSLVLLFTGVSLPARYGWRY